MDKDINARIQGAKARVMEAVAEYTANTVAAARVSLNSNDPISQELHAMVGRSRAKLDERLQHEFEQLAVRA